MRRYCLYMFENIFRRAEKPPQRKDDAEAQERINNTIDTEALSEEMESGIFHNNQELIETLARLVIELEDNITEYDTVLSDDTGGRFPSLLLKQIIDKKREEVEKDRAQIYFIAGGWKSNEKRNLAIKEFIAGKKDSFGKTLLVTEYIESGKSIQFFMNILEQQNIVFDTATVSMLNKPDYYNEEIKYGKIGKIGRYSFWRKPSSSGVEKRPEDESAHPKRVKWFDPEKSRAVRKDIDTLSEELSKLIS